ncbi:MAG: tRNA lysidine(34) synthetase TilS [Oscillospiraceae bacterium]|nr:tRNA lysidine(34) synthetase TilS [Oscillospiraceae bacterium]
MDLTAWMEQWNMFPDAGGTVLCAVSGGRDSVCLLHYLCSLARRCGFSVAAGHYNHHMRPTAQRDEDYVRSLCEQLDVPFYTDGCDVVAAAREAGLGVEEMGRRLRYEFLERLADRLGAQRVATAHHQADQAETVLLNLLRGTGPEGLGGIPPVRGRLIRPLLNTSREEIEAYLAEHGLGHVEDETNESLNFARNRLRHNVMPELEKIHPALRRSIARTAQIVSRENRYLDELAAGYLPGAGAEISCAVLQSAPEVLRPRMVRLLLERLGTGKKDISAVHLEAVLALNEKGRGMVSLPGAEAVCRSGVLILCAAERAAQELALAEETVYGAWQVCLRRLPATAQRRADALYVAERYAEMLRLGPWQSGDGLELPGSRGKRSIKRLLTERGVAPEVRRSVPCVRVDATAAAVPGLGTDVHYLPEENGGMIEIVFQKNERTQEEQR